MNGYQSKVVLGALLTYRMGPRCVVNTAASYVLTDAASGLLAVSGNPVHTHLQAVLGPGESGADEQQPLYAWANWCNHQVQPPFTYRVLTQAETATQTLQYTEPGCTDPSKPSELRSFG